MKIKVCGLRDADNIKAVAALKPDYMGFIFYNGSPRFVNSLTHEALQDVPAEVNKTAVFVNESAYHVNEIIDKYNFDFIQLHGSETPAFCKALRKNAIVIKAFGVNADFDFSKLKAYEKKVDLFLFDTKTEEHGGSGKTFGWNLLDKYELDTPFFLSGGIGLDNVDEALQVTHPSFYGVDLNSKFELSPGVKDLKKLEEAFSIIKQRI